ncbi:DUF6867 family protein [Limoniibacter endophyticus]|uniref:DUF6867 domain-containing protein n=1 Tax=Limoniibacter endophyticus TaxID=1565040 RepID=A0A8J3DN99_9HYPH|nr:hypothetical protein [Limoniibacter endophyticus]GHC73525.1 hypothetical protein GCM10010136_21710 [Limoniibacter endophyticus]
MQGILYEETSLWSFLFVTVVLGGWTAWMTGRACARTWRPVVQLIPYLMLLGLFVRFIHYALFQASLTSLHYYLVDTVILLIFGLIAFRFTRTHQMVSQYSWLYEKTSPLSWKDKAAS